MVCHIHDLILRGFRKISIRTGDSDVLAILLGFMNQFMDTAEDLILIVDFKTSGSRRIISVNSIYSKIGKKMSSGMMFFHSFTGADSTNAFFRVSKKDWLSAWISFPFKKRLSGTFKKLSSLPSEDDVIYSMEILHQFLIFAYTKSFDEMDIDKIRFNLFKNKSSNELRVLPPSKDALL